MNKYVKEVMEKNSSLPKTFEEYQRLSSVDVRRIPMSYVQKLRDEYDAKISTVKGLKPIAFDKR